MNPIDSALAQSASLLAGLEKDPNKSILLEDSDNYNWYVSGSLSKPNLYAVRFSWYMGGGSRSYNDLLSQEIAVNRIALCILYKEKKHPEVLKFSASLIRGTDSERLYHTSLDMIFAIFKSLYDNEQEDEALTFLSSLDKENPYFSYSLRQHLLFATRCSISRPEKDLEFFTISSEKRDRLITSTANKPEFLKVLEKENRTITKNYCGMNVVAVLEKAIKRDALTTLLMALKHTQKNEGKL